MKDAKSWAMMKDINIDNPLLQVIDDTYNKSTDNDLDFFIKNRNIKMISKWTCFSDYCFDNKNKPNDVMTFTLLPYIYDFNSLSKFIKKLARKDIKKIKSVEKEFIVFLKNYPLINFSFILNNKKELFKIDGNTVNSFLVNTFTFMKKQYNEWGMKQPDQKKYYDEIVKKINCTLQLIKNTKKIKQLTNMLLVTFFGAYVSNKVLQKLKNIEIFGWFSDRDAINEVCNNFSIELFQYYLHGLIGGKNIDFAAAPAKSHDNAFYEEFVRIPDYIAGTLADYDMQKNLISKKKFDDILTNYMAENRYNNFIFRLFIEENKLSCTRVIINKKS